jgi:hypothetical protein
MEVKMPITEGKGRVWTEEERWESIVELKGKLYTQDGSTQAAINQRCAEERKKRQELIDASNSLPLGRKNNIDQMFRPSQRSGRDNPRFRNSIYQAEGPRAYQKDRKPGSKDGKKPWKEKLAPIVKEQLDTNWQDDRNQIFTDAENDTWG